MLSSSNIYRINHGQYDRNRDTDSFDSAYTDTTSGLYSDYEKCVQIKSASLNKTFEENLDKVAMPRVSDLIKRDCTLAFTKMSTLKRLHSSSGECDLNQSTVTKEKRTDEKLNQNSAVDIQRQKSIEISEKKSFEFDDKDIVFANGRIKSGTIDAIINFFIQQQDQKPKKFTQFAILLSVRLFMPPHKLFKELFNRVVYGPSMYGIYSKENLQKSCHEIIRILAEWTEMFPYDFREQKMMSRYRKITTKCLDMDKNLKDDIIAITSNLLKNMRNLEMYESYLNRIHFEASSKLMKSVVELNILSVSEDPCILAQQLTHIELDRLKHVSAEEFIQYCNMDELNAQNLNCGQSMESSMMSSFLHGFNDKLGDCTRTSNNLEAYIQWFNRLTNFITTEIVKHLKRDTRVKIINYFIDVAYQCFHIGNYNSLMAIIASLNTSSVSRLKKTWIKIDQSKLDALQKKFDFFNNYSTYRQILKNSKSRFDESNTNVVIPIFALIMKDLTSLTDGIPNKLGNEHINFEKFWNFAKYISEILNFKNGVCLYKEKSKIINYLLTTPLLTEDACVLASYECEPPETDSERKHRDKLRLRIKETAYFHQSFD